MARTVWIWLLAGLLAAGVAAWAQAPDEGWRDIASAAGVTASMGAVAMPGGSSPKVLCDGSVGTASQLVGHANLNAQFGMQFAWCAFESRWKWPQAQAIAAVDLFVVDPLPEHAAPVCVKLRARDAEGNYTIRLLHNENLSWQAAEGWQDTGEPDQKAQTVRLELDRPCMTSGLQIIVGHHRSWVALGDVRIWSAPPPPEPAQAKPQDPAALQLWFANPWGDTKGGTELPGAEELDAAWSLRMCRNDTEQAMIGLLNTGTEPGTVTVSLAGTPPGMQAELLAVGAVLGRGTTTESWHKDKSHTALINLFSKDQVKGFGGYFPSQLLDSRVWEQFPVLTLLPGKPAYVWAKLTTDGGLPAQEFKLRFSAGPASRDLSVKVLKVRLPEAPVVESYPYGGVNDEDSRAHHTTVNGGYRHFVTSNLVVHMGKWGTDFVKLAQDDPEGFRKLIREGVDDLHKDLTAQGYRREQILVEIWDEPNDANIDSWLLMAKEIKAHDAAALIYSNPPEDWAGHPCTLEKTVQPMAPYVDVWAPHLNLINQFPETLACMKATGKPIWFYQNVGLAYSRNEAPASGWYRTAPWYALRHDLQGVGFWAASSYYGDQWDDFDSTPYVDWPDAAVLFKDETGQAIATRNWEAWREGIEDVALGRMLRLALTRDWLRKEDRLAAERWLAEMPERVISENQKTQGGTVALARGQVLDWLDATWKDERGLDRQVCTEQ